MRIAFLCKRRYMGKDVILDRYARLYEIPRQLAHLDNEVGAFCLDYHAADTDGCWEHEAAPGRLRWHSLSVGRTRLPRLAAYPWHLLRQLRAFKPDILVGASDIPHVVLARWLARRLQVPYAIDLYDNFEGFGQARIPGFVPALRRAVRDATVVTTTSEPLRQKVLADGARGTVIAMPSSVDLAVFHPGDKAQARQALSLPQDGKLVGTAGGLYREKGIEPLYAAWPALAASRPDVHLVLAGPLENGFAPPQGERVHYLGHLAHGQIANLFRALDVASSPSSTPPSAATASRRRRTKCLPASYRSWPPPSGRCAKCAAARRRRFLPQAIRRHSPAPCCGNCSRVPRQPCPSPTGRR